MDDTRLPEQSKGKARMSRDEDTSATDVSHLDSSLMSKVVSSAQGLARDAVSTRDGNAARTLGSNSLLAGKPGPSASPGQGVGTSEGGSAATIRTRPSPTGHVLNGFTDGAAESFRTQQASNGVEHEFLEFAASGVEHPSDRDNSETASSDWSHHWNSTMRQKHLSNDQQTESYDIATKVNYNDGAEVRALLSDPSFNAHIDPLIDEETVDSFERHNVDDLFPQTFTGSEQVMVDKIRSDLPAPPRHNPVPTNHPLNLRPLTEAEKLSMKMDIEKLEPGFGLFPQTDHASDWEAVLTNYSDEVWGDLLPAVRTAREDVKEAASSGTAMLDRQAVARLKMIMGHMQQVGLQTLDSMFAHRQRLPARQMNEGKPLSIPRFQCPRLTCHKRFHCEWELYHHSTDHSRFNCPHVDCQATYTLMTDWLTHINSAHHDTQTPSTLITVGDTIIASSMRRWQSNWATAVTV